MILLILNSKSIQTFFTLVFAIQKLLISTLKVPLEALLVAELKLIMYACPQKQIRRLNQIFFFLVNLLMANNDYI